jgi:5-methylthioribose kinase
MSTDLLSPATVVSYLRGRGVIGSGTAFAEELSGGVSNVVLAVTGEEGRFVVKQSLERLRVADDWYAPQRRVLAEAAALRVAHSLTPNAVPTVVDVDPVRMTLTMGHAGAGWTDWKSHLIVGDVDERVAPRLGQLLGQWHAQTESLTLVPELSADAEAFELLRLAPYHATVAERMPELADKVLEIAQRIRESHVCLVHGDFSPKNILVSPSGDVWVIDFEVAHRGDPVFDLAFLLTHLTLKAIHVPAAADRLDTSAADFLAAYRLAVGARLGFTDEYLMMQIGCLLLARVVGKSPAEYLTQTERELAVRLGRDLLSDGTGGLAALQDARRENVSWTS